MPIYDYECPSCGHEEALLCKHEDADYQICEDCGSSLIRKLSAPKGHKAKDPYDYL